MKSSMPSPFFSISTREFKARFGRAGVADRLPWSLSQLRAVREHFPDATLVYANEGGYEVGERIEGTDVG
jgi:hypothetical protein